MKAQFGVDLYKAKQMNKVMTVLYRTIFDHLEQNENFSNEWHARELGEKIVDALAENDIYETYES